MNIDLHGHFVPDTMFEYVRKHGDKIGKELVTKDGQDYVFHRSGNMCVKITRGYYDYDAKMADMEKMGIDKSVLSISPLYLNYEVKKEYALDTCMIANDWVAERVCTYPESFGGMAAVPMQDADMALKELERAHTELGLHALCIAPMILDKMLDEEEFFPIYEYCANNGILIYMHPNFPDPEVLTSFSKYYTVNLIALMTQTCVALTRLIFGGVLEKYPALKVLASHAGGHFPYQLGRLIHGYEVREEPKINGARSPEKYLKNVYFDTITHWTPALQFLVDAFGADQVVIGTDYPYDMGDFRPFQNVDALRISQSDREKICHKNAELLGF